MRRLPGAFTMVEMVVVLAISLMLMVLVVPIFRVTTRTVSVIERRLAVFEAGRTILDLIEAEMKVGVANEKGQHWSLKHVSWLETDPFMPAGPNPAIVPGIADKSNLAYRYDRRFSDCVDYVRLDGLGCASAWTPGPTQFPGGKCFPLAYPASFGSEYFTDVWKASMRSTLLYQNVLEWWSRDFDSDSNYNRWNRNEQLSDVSQTELSFIFYPQYCQWSHYGPMNRFYDQVPDFFGPGKEVRPPIWYAGYLGVALQRRLGQIKLMDLSISYWDDSPAATGGKQFKDLPDNTEVLFWPPPKAIRVAITVCDREKRDTVTLVRIIQITAGTGSGVVNIATNDNAYYTDAPGVVFQPMMDTNNRLYYVNADNTPAAGKIQNRLKYMPSLPAAFNGDASNPWANDWSTASESTTVLSDGVKPYKWP